MARTGSCWAGGARRSGASAAWPRWPRRHRARRPGRRGSCRATAGTRSCSSRGRRCRFPLSSADEPIELEIRVLARFGEDADTADPRRIRVFAGDRLVEELAAPAGEGTDFQVLRTSVTLAAGEPLVIEAVDRIAVQSVTGYVPDGGPPPGWSILTETDDAVVWGRTP